MRKISVKSLGLWLTFFLFVFYISCEFSVEPSTIDLEETPIELKWIQHSREGQWFISRYKNLFDNGIECDQILLYLENRYFTYSIGDTLYLQEMRDYLYENWIWSEEKK